MRNNNSTFTGSNNSSSDPNVLIVDGQSYTLARSESFYYLQFINYDKELFKNASNLSSKPTVIFYNDGTSRAILDYTLANSTDKLYLNSFFANLNAGTDGFSLANGSYLDPSNLTADITCGLTFTSYEEYKAFVTVKNVTEQNAALDIYFGDYFTETPQLIKGGTLGFNSDTINYALISVNPKTNKPLSYMGMKAGDVIEVVNSTATNNKYKFKINEIVTLNNKEVLKLDPIYTGVNPVLESLIGSESVINLYVKGTIDTQVDLTDTNLGCCFIGTNDQFGTILGTEPTLNATKYDTLVVRNTTKDQCKIITGEDNKFFKSCVNPAYNIATNVLVNNTLDNARYFGVPNNVLDIQFVDNAFQISKSVNDLNTTNYFEYQDGILYLKPQYLFRLEQEHISNGGKNIRFSVDENNTMLYQTNITGRFASNGYLSLIYIRLTSNTPDLYMFVEDNTDITPIKIQKLI